MTPPLQIIVHGMVLLIFSLSSRSVRSFVTGRTSVARVQDTVSITQRPLSWVACAGMEPMEEWNQKSQHVSHSHQSPDLAVDDSPRRIKRSRPTNRPGFNSYLKVILDKATMNTLHQMSLNVQQQIQQSNPIPTSIESQDEKFEQVSETASQSLPTNNASMSLTYRPRAQTSLHMTLFFGGETICALPSQELHNWHTRISQRLEQSGFFLEGHNHEREPVDTTVKDFGFCISGLKVFPPQRNNLVAAILEPKDEWHDLYRDLRDIAQDESCSPQLANIVEYSKEKWIAHVTLGNLIGGKKSDRKQLDTRLLDSVFDSTLAALSMNGAAFEARTQGIGMGGPIPEQLELAWDFHFAGTSYTKSGTNCKDL